MGREKGTQLGRKAFITETWEASPDPEGKKKTA